jgi:cellulose synthase/poly-beta-1,6-N-acetylglucosamine synthase-like glycosyltransferase
VSSAGTQGQGDAHAAPTFSIIMPSYNTGATIDAAIRSVLTQTRADLELIVADDGSTDDTPTRVQRFQEDTRVKLIRAQHRGPSAARNAALAEALGEYVCFLDSDDVWLPTYLDVMAATLRANPDAAVAYTDAWVLFDSVKKIGRRTAMAEYRPASVPQEPTAFLCALLESGNFVYYSAMVRRCALEAAGPFNETLRGPEDYELWLRIAAHGYAFVRCHEVLAVYRRRPGQLTADPSTIDRALPEVYRLVVDEYDVHDRVREVASRRARQHAERIREPAAHSWTRLRASVLARPYGAFLRLRWFYRRPPESVRNAFPNLDEL